MGIQKNKSLIIYDEEDRLLYRGDFKSYKYNGNGIIYYKNGNKQYEGEFKDGFFDGNGILYDLEGKKVYEGSFKNNLPKEGNLKLYKLNGDLYYEGNLLNYKYNGNGKLYDRENNNSIFEGEFQDGKIIKGILYEYSEKIYEGEFKENEFNGYGKLYSDNYQDNHIIYEGNFKDGKIFGKGIKYYGTKKIEGNFVILNPYKGMYFNPLNSTENNKEIPPFFSKNSNNEKDNLIKYEEELQFIKDVSEAKLSKDINTEYIKVLLISAGDTGKSQILLRLTRNKYISHYPATIGVDFTIRTIKHRNNINNIQIWDTDIFFNIVSSYCKGTDVFIIVFDLSKKNVSIFEESLNKKIKEQENYKEKLIYLVGNKLDITLEYLKEYREKAKLLIDSGEIDKYFEVSARSGEGIEQFANILKIDCSIYASVKKNKKLFNEYFESGDFGKENIEKTIDKFIQKLNKYFDY